MNNGDLFVTKNSRKNATEYLHIDSCGQAQGEKSKILKLQNDNGYYLSFVVAGEYVYNTNETLDETEIGDVGTLIIFPPEGIIHLEPVSAASSRFWIKVYGECFLSVLKDCEMNTKKAFRSVYSKKTENNFLKIVSEIQMDNICRETKCNAHLLEFISEIARQAKNSSFTTKYANKKLIPAFDIIYKDFMKNISIDSLAEACFLSKCYFIRLFKSSVGVTPHAYINTVRIKNAKQYLIDMPNESVSQIAYSVGFNDLAHFRKVFGESVGMSPVQYRNSFL